LIPEAFVEGQEDFKTILLGKRQEFSVFLARKSYLWNGRTIMASQAILKLSRDALVE
jgi:hypothetical protein